VRLLRRLPLVSVSCLAVIAVWIRPGVSAAPFLPQSRIASPAQPGVAARRPDTAPDGSCAACHGATLKRAVVHAPASEDCTTCHTRQGTAHRFTMAAEGADLCTSCHAVQTPNDRFVHGPVATGDCVSCHDPHGGARRGLLRTDGSALCLTCHVEMQASIAQHRYAHGPVQTDCAGCHDPHASPNKYQLKATGSALCFTCHTDLQQKVGQAPVKHDALTTERQCLGCHEPHVADIRPQLRATTMTLCLACHDREITAGDRTLVNIKAWLANNPDAHGPIRQQDCVACHRPHASEHFRLLTHDYPSRFYSGFDPANYELCFTCHEPDLVRVERTTTLTGFRDGDRNLHFLHVNRAEKGRTCRACHEVHSSTKPKHIREKVPFGAWALPIKYENQEGGGKCSPGCHVAVEYRRAANTVHVQPKP